MVGAITILCSFAYLILGLKSCSNQKTEVFDNSSEADKEEAEKLSSHKLIFIAILATSQGLKVEQKQSNPFDEIRTDA